MFFSKADDVEHTNKRCEYVIQITIKIHIAYLSFILQDNATVRCMETHWSQGILPQLAEHKTNCFQQLNTTA